VYPDPNTGRKFSPKRKFFAKTKIFAKSERVFAYFRFLKMKKGVFVSTLTVCATAAPTVHMFLIQFNSKNNIFETVSAVLLKPPKALSRSL
jgi:hypothetical protein